MKQVVQLLIDIAEEGGDVSVLTDYSGRFMYGEKCVALVGDLGDVLAIITATINELFDAVIEQTLPQEKFKKAVTVLLQYKADDMGRSRVFYWPDLQTESEDEN